MGSQGIDSALCCDLLQGYYGVSQKGEAESRRQLCVTTCCSGWNMIAFLRVSLKMES